MIKNSNVIKLIINNINKELEDLEIYQAEHNNCDYLSQQENETITDNTQLIYEALSNLEELI